nr:hypothetical protein [Leptospira interrogans]
MDPNIDFKDADLNIRKHLSTDKIVLLPNNWHSDEKEFLFSENTITVNKLFISNGLAVKMIGISEESKYINNRHIEGVAPALFLSSAFISSNPNATSIALSIIANYLTDLFKGFSKEPDVTIRLYIENKRGEIKEAVYKGPVSGVDKFQKSMKEFTNLK